VQAEAHKDRIRTKLRQLEICLRWRDELEDALWEAIDAAHKDGVPERDLVTPYGKVEVR
jgi:hypothetical protein